MCGPSGGGGGDATAFARQQAAEARAREAERAAQIRTGREQINRLFNWGQTRQPTGRTIQVENPAWAAWAGERGPGDPLYQTALGAVLGMTPPGQRFVEVPETEWVKTSQGFNDAFYDRYRQAHLDYYLPQLQRQYDDAREQMTYALARAGITRSSAAGDKLADLERTFGEERGRLAVKAEEGVSRLRSDVENERASLLAQLETATDPGAVANTALARSSALASRPIQYSPIGDVFAGVADSVGGFARGLRERRILDAVSAASTAPASGVKGASRVVGR